MSERSDFNDLAQEAGGAAVAEIVAKATRAASAGMPAADVVSIGDAWPDPILPGQRPVPEIPAALLPSWLGDMAGAVAESTQTPSAMAVMISLSVLATCLHRRFEVAPWGEDDDYSEPLALWTLTALPSGSRKSAVIGDLAKPLVEWEKLERDRLRPEIVRVEAARLVAKKQIEKLTKAATNVESAERERIQNLIQDEKKAMPAEVIAPRLFTGDITSERLQQLLAEHAERMAVLSDEAGIFNIMAGLYSGGMASIDVFLQGHAGASMRVDRAGRTAHLDRPALSFGLALQPDVLADVADNRRFRDSGLLARFLFAMPVSNVGKRDVRRRWSIPSFVSKEYERRLFGLLEGRELVASRPRVLGMSKAARAVWLDFAEEIEHAMAEHGALESIGDWAAKLSGAAARIAALCELAQRGVGAQAVEADVTEKAVQLCRLLIPHAQAAFGLLGADSVDGDAAAIVRWARDKRLPTFNKSKCQKALEGRFRSVARLDKAIERLEQSDAAKVEKQPNRGARATTNVRMNPKLFDIV
jgi:putative DNA primase/helicase